MKACKPCRKAVLACTLCAFALPATAAEYPGLEGDIVKELRFQDKSGENAVVLTEREKIREQEGSSLWSKDIRAYRYRLQGDTASQAWQIHDYVHDCETSVTAEFLQDEIAITDLDDNGQSEIWVPYLIRCAGDVSPSTMKIIMYEGQKKHALRGRNLLPSMAGYTGEPGEGEYRADAAFQKAKPQIRKFGDLLWQRALKASLQGQQ